MMHMMGMRGVDLDAMPDHVRENMRRMMISMPAMQEGMMNEDADVAFACGMIAHHHGAGRNCPRCLPRRAQRQHTLWVGQDARLEEEVLQRHTRLGRRDVPAHGNAVAVIECLNHTRLAKASFW